MFSLTHKYLHVAQINACMNHTAAEVVNIGGLPTKIVNTSVTATPYKGCLAWK